MSGQIDWAVYSPGQFPAGFTGYVPDPLQFVYAYQVILTTADPALAYFGVTLVEANAHNIGTFTGDGGFGQVSGAAPIQQFLFSGAFPRAAWEFDSSQSILVSGGLVFTSLFRPHFIDGSVIGDLSGGNVVPLPAPFYAPEPSTFVLAALGLIGLVVWRRRKR